MTTATAFGAAPFRPHPLFANQHAQTVLGTLLPRSFPDAASWRQTGEERLFTLADGDRLLGVLHRHPGDPGRQKPLLLLMHGLEGAIDSHYVKGMAIKAHRLGYHALRLNFRNCGQTEHLAETIYNSTLIDDIDQVLRALAAEGWPVLAPVGVSMSANMLLNLLARYGDRPPVPLLGAVAISPPIEQTLVSQAFGEGFNRVYDAYFLVKLRAKMARRAALRPDRPEVAEAARLARRVKTLREFDDRITSQLLGVPDALAYYEAVSAGDRLGDVRVPTLIIHAQDDPFLPFAMFERRLAAIAANPALTTLFPAQGGHVGFMERPRAPGREAWMDGYWAENQALRYVRWLAEAR
jgi:predicted alpha/beta-fold hydrolase